MLEPQLHLYMSGSEFDNGYNLYYLSKGLLNIQTLIDKSYLTIENKEKMTEKDREFIQVKADNLRSGSFNADIVIDLARVGGALLPAFTSMTPITIWNLVTESFSFLNTVFAGNRKGETFSLQPGANSMVNVINGNGNKIIQIHPDAILMAQKAEKTFEDLTKLISPEKGVENISVFGRATGSKGLYVGIEERTNFENKKRLDPTPVSFKGMIIKVDGIGFNGKIRVIEGDHGISPGEYHFEFLVKDNPDKLRNSFLNVKSFNALKETTLNSSTLEQRIYKLRIIETK
ncbi:hypothetical protein D1B31_15450 [Neobacillus notoginsengisoli]|uniref:Uncharacterized protein n=1 Tax=Neobacillus notoginsengisoli TaxID=1578198 RepID=A0A417YS79_9BACI|nr:hypothetical protein [Neobacillus notoginsengisoli]RHW38164.1 hypothetical protein D1B31_15450 [Neobacillus notoginsengisoli]